MDSTGITVGVGEVLRQKEMRRPLRILIKSPRLECPFPKAVLEPHFIVEVKTVTKLTMDSLETTAPHLLWLDDACSYTENEHTVIRTAMKSGSTVFACLGHSDMGQSSTSSSIGSTVRSSLQPLLDCCGFVLVNVYPSSAVLPTIGHHVAHKAMATTIGGKSRRRRPGPSRRGRTQFAVGEIAFPDDFPDEVRRLCG